MQTIIYTNCKREAANYEVDKICFADRVDMSQIIEEEMNKHNIRHVHFWVITDNIINIEGVSEEKLLLGVGKYLTENKDMTFDVEYVVEKYTSCQETKYNKKDSGNSVDYQDCKRHKYDPSLGELSLSGTFGSGMLREGEQSSFQMSKSKLMQEEVLKQSLKHATFGQLQSFLKKQTKSKHIDESIKSFIFKTSEESITISFIESNKRNLIKKIIQQDCDRFYDAKLKNKTTFTASQGYQDLLKKYNHIGLAQTLYNKVILFLFSAQKNEQMTLARRRTKLMQSKAVPSAQAIKQWKIKEENVDMIGKLEKETDLIKQEIENQKIVFRNKIKMIENFIGESINVERLMQEEEEIQSVSHLTTPLTQKKSPFGKRDSIAQIQLAQQLTPNRFSVNAPYISSQFKRLKDKSDAMRNIDNTLLEQNKKIDSANKKIKDMIKLKESIIFSNACELNKLRQEILQAKSEIARKQIEIKQKQKNGTITQILHYKSRDPSTAAKAILEKYEQFCNDYKTSKCYELAEDPNQSQIKNKFQIKLCSQSRTLHRSLHSSSVTKFNVSSQAFNNRFREKRLQETQSCLKALNKSKDQNLSEASKLVKKQVLIGDQRLIEQLQYTSNNAENLERLKHQIKIQSMYEQLIALFDYYNKNLEICKEMNAQIASYHTVEQQPINTFIKEITNTDKSRIYTKSHLRFTRSQNFDCRDELELQSFPILKDYILQEIQQKQGRKTVNNSTKTPQTPQRYKQQISYPRDCFQIMINTQKKEKAETIIKTNTSIKSQLYDRVIQQPSEIMDKVEKISAVVPPKKPIKQKRITIQQAIKLSNQLNSQKNK